MIIRHYISLLLLCCGSLLFAQDIKVTATISTRQVVTGEPFEITFSVNGNAERFDPPNLSAFQVVGGPNQSQSMSSINGNTSVSIGISYDLVAQKEGTFVIGSATVTVGGHTYTSNPVKVTVVKGSPAHKRNNNSSNSKVSRLFQPADPAIYPKTCSSGQYPIKPMFTRASS
jgi:hypothetical protein